MAGLLTYGPIVDDHHDPVSFDLPRPECWRPSGCFCLECSRRNTERNINPFTVAGAVPDLAARTAPASLFIPSSGNHRSCLYDAICALSKPCPSKNRFVRPFRSGSLSRQSANRQPRTKPVRLRRRSVDARRQPHPESGGPERDRAQSPCLPRC